MRASRSRRLASVAGVAALVAAVVSELRKPPEDRGWHGRLFGVVPYELRPPTVARVRERWWNPDDERFLTEHVFGIGWSLNLARCVRLFRRAD